MKNKGFTLIELLAVIVILAIVALIATPIILGIINDTKEQSNKRSVENYADSIKNALVRYQLKENKKTILFEDIEKYIEYDGNVVCNIIQIYEDGSIYLNNCIVNDNSEGYSYGKQHITKQNARAATATTTGIVPVVENNNIKSGSEFKIKVSDNIKDENGDIAEYTFFVLSNSEDGKYVNLIAEQNITIDGIFTSEPQDGDEWYVTPSNSYDNRYGPQTAYNYLSAATSNWTNIPIIESFYYEDKNTNKNLGYRNIETKLNQQTGEYITTITPLSGGTKTYQNMRARLPYISEVTSTQVGCTTSDYWSCPLWMRNYIEKGGNNSGYWLLSSYPDYGFVYSIGYYGIVGPVYSDKEYEGIRPVITVLKSDLLKVME